MRGIPPLAMKALSWPKLSQQVYIAVACTHLVTKLHEVRLVPERRIRHIDVDDESLALQKLLANTSLPRVTVIPGLHGWTDRHPSWLQRPLQVTHERWLHDAQSTSA